MRNLLLLLLMPLLPACQYYPERDNTYHDKPGDSTTWRRFYYEDFALKTPGDWVRYSFQDGDRQLSGLTNGTDSLELDEDFGSAPLADDRNRLFAAATIDGFTAIIGIPKIEGQGDCEVHLYPADYWTFRLNGHVSNTRIALDIFRSVTFDHGRPALTDSLSLNEFSATYPRTGRAVFTELCKDCHNRRRMIIGPPLSSEFLENRSDQWIYSFLTNRKKRVLDSLERAYKEEFGGLDCPEQTNLSRADFDRLIKWLRTPEAPMYDVEASRAGK